MGVNLAVGVLYEGIPLTLSLSPWERGRCGTLQAQFKRSFSHGEKDRMRGASFVHAATPHRQPLG